MIILNLLFMDIFDSVRKLTNSSCPEVQEMLKILKDDYGIVPAPQAFWDVDKKKNVKS